MDSTELTRALHAATEDLEPRPGFTAAVVRGGRRRRVRNRVMVATAAATVTALAGAGTYVIWLDPKPGETQVADARLSQPTRGDLAGDRAFLNEAAAAWRSGRAAERLADLRGQPHVYWAGNTPSGRAAVVMQGFFQSEEIPDDPDRTATLIGLVATDPADRQLKEVFLTMDPWHDPSTAHGFQFGPGDRTILVVAGDSPLWLSPGRGNDADGRIARDWQPMPITDGVAVATLPDGASPYAARVLERKTRPAPDDTTGTGMIRLEPASYYLERSKPGNDVLPPHPVTDRRLNWTDHDMRQMRVGDTAGIRLPGDVPSTFVNAVEAAGMADFGAKTSGPGAWSVVAGLTDGRTAVVSEYAQDENPSRIYAVLLKPDGSVARVVAGEQVDPAAALPVKLRLPDGQGWVIAQRQAQLAYRMSPDGPWQDAGTNAALLPDGAVQVRVTAGGSATEVDLGR